MGDAATAELDRPLRGGQSRLKRSRATADRYRDLLSGVFKRALRDGLVSINPVRTVSKFKEAGDGSFASPRPKGPRCARRCHRTSGLFTVSIHPGLRWSEQVGLRWPDADLLTGFTTVPRSKHAVANGPDELGGARRAGGHWARRTRPDDPDELVFLCRHPEPDEVFPKAVESAQAAPEGDWEGREPAR
jgi:integrase